MFMIDPTVLAIVVGLGIVWVIASDIFATVRKRRRELANLAETWGQPLRSAREHRPLAARTPREATVGTAWIDDQTWSDLDLARVFTRIDHTLSSLRPGC